MNHAAILLIALSSDGYWLSGSTETIQVQWTTEERIPGITLDWRLVCGEAQLVSGRVTVTDKNSPPNIRIAVPAVRTHTPMRVAYHIEQAGKIKPIAEGTAAVEVYPDNLLDGVAKRLSSRYLSVGEQPEALAKHLYVWDQPEKLPSLLKQAKIKHTSILSDAELSFVLPDVLIVGSNRLESDTGGQQKLLQLATAGTNVLILNQTKPAVLAGYPLVQRTVPAKLAWQKDHPLTASLRWFDPSRGKGDLWAIRLPASEPALEIAWWPRESAGKSPASIDSLVVCKNVGRGRIVLCQVPLGSWRNDPRSQLFLVGALDYLASPVVPTPSPNRRPQSVEPASHRPASQLVLP
ncbi:MAG: hypothetical protein WCJ35_14320 [Planctomycetota bacterium]